MTHGRAHPLTQHRPGYSDAYRAALVQSEAHDYALIDALQGPGNLPADPTAQEVKAEALRQLEIDWRTDCPTAGAPVIRVPAHEEGRRAGERWAAEASFHELAE